jgi:lipocalin
MSVSITSLLPYRLLAAAVCFALLFLPGPGQAQFTQQGPKLVGTGTIAGGAQGYSVALSADGNTAIVGDPTDDPERTGLEGVPHGTGAAWVFTRSNGVWTQQGNKLVGTGAIGEANHGASVSLSGDGNTAIVGGSYDNSGIGAAWVFTRSGGVWTQQSDKLVGTDYVGYPFQGASVSMSADGNTAIVGGPFDNNEDIGAAWVYTRSGGVWTQQGSKLVGAGTANGAGLGRSVALSAQGNTAIVGGPSDNFGVGAAWVFTRSGGVWTQQGSKLVGTNAVGERWHGYSVALSADGNTALAGGPQATGVWVYTRSGGVWTQQGNVLVGTGGAAPTEQGFSVALSGDGNTAIVGGPCDDSDTGAAWVFTRSGGVWTQQGSKLVGTGAVGELSQGYSVALSGDGNTAVVGGPLGTFPPSVGATWVFVQSAGTLQVSPASNIAASGTQGEAFSPASFQYQLTSTVGSVNFLISGIPTWLNASFTSGTATTTPVTVTFTLIKPSSFQPGTYTSTITFTNTSNGQGNTTRTATLVVNAGTKDSCKDDGWKNYVSFPGPFKNQGQCVSYFAKQAKQ